VGVGYRYYDSRVFHGFSTGRSEAWVGDSMSSCERVVGRISTGSSSAGSDVGGDCCAGASSALLGGPIGGPRTVSAVEPRLESLSPPTDGGISSLCWFTVSRRVKYCRNRVFSPSITLRALRRASFSCRVMWSSSSTSANRIRSVATILLACM